MTYHSLEDEEKTAYLYHLIGRVVQQSFRGSLDTTNIVQAYNIQGATNENETGKAWMRVLNPYLQYIGTA
jgi:hypothetical protein